MGKGRDVGMQQIYKFEAKLSQGNAEQVLSRDVHRIAARLDFVRLLSYFFGGIGHYINSCLTVFTVLTVVYTGVFFAVFDLEHVGGQRIVPLGRVQVLPQGFGSTFADAGHGEFTVRYQGCAEAGFCYPPQEREFRIAAEDTSLHILRDPRSRTRSRPF